MKGKRIISLVLTLSLVLSSTVVFALEGVQKNSSINVIPDEVIVKDIGSGAFEIVSAANKQTLYSEDKSVNLVKVENEIYKAKDPTSVGKNEMFLRVKDNIFQKVEKIDLGLINKTNVEEKIKNKKVKKEVAQDLRELAELSETENVETGAILYAAAATTYYVGYGNYNYSEEVLYTYQRTPFRDVKKGTDLAGVANVSMKTIADYLLEAAGYAYLGVAFTLQDLYSSVFTVFPASTGDWWQVQLYETKYTKYCGIDNMWDGTYSVKATSEKGTGTFTHNVYDYSLDFQSKKTGSKLTYQLPNYNNLDYYAYLHQYPSDIPYIEEITKWRVNTYYSFSSI